MDSFIRNKPLVINWMISGKCNLYCEFCYGQFLSSQIKKEDKFYILNQIAEHKVPKLILTGGEPMLDNDIIEIIKMAYSHGIFTSLHTNGLLVNELFIQKIKKYIGRISLPLDGSSDYMNFLMRGEDKYFTKIIKLIEILKEKQISFSIKTVASKINLNDIEKIAEIMLFLNPHIWLITEFKPLRRGKSYQDKFQLNPGDFDILKSKIKSYPLNVGFFSNDNLSHHPHFFINANGEVFTNGIETDFKIGSIFKESIPVLWSKIMEKNKVNKLYFESAITIKK